MRERGGGKEDERERDGKRGEGDGETAAQMERDAAALDQAPDSTGQWLSVLDEDMDTTKESGKLPALQALLERMENQEHSLGMWYHPRGGTRTQSRDFRRESTSWKRRSNL